MEVASPEVGVVVADYVDSKPNTRKTKSRRRLWLLSPSFGISWSVE